MFEHWKHQRTFGEIDPEVSIMSISMFASMLRHGPKNVTKKRQMRNKFLFGKTETASKVKLQITARMTWKRMTLYLLAEETGRCFKNQKRNTHNKPKEWPGYFFSLDLQKKLVKTF